MAVRSSLHSCSIGFTLIELLITLAVAAIVLASSAPAMGSLVARQALVSAGNSLVTGLQLARYQAVSSGKPVRLCAAYDPNGCADRAAWSYGWLIQPEGVMPATGTTQHGQLPSGIQASLSQGRQHVRFLPDGRSPGTNLTLQLCSRNRVSRQIIISNSGRVRSGPITDAPC